MILDTNFSNRNEPVLLSAKLDGDLKLRIDRNGLAQPNFKEPPIVVLTCVGCDVPAGLINRLTENLDKRLHYEIGRQGGSARLLLTIDNSMDEPELGCKDVLEEFSEYTQPDLLQKCRRLARLYLASDEELFVVEHNYGALVANLHNALKKQVDISTRKAAFFAQFKPEKAVESIGYLQACHKAIYLLNWEMERLTNKGRR